MKRPDRSNTALAHEQQPIINDTLALFSRKLAREMGIQDTGLFERDILHLKVLQYLSDHQYFRKKFVIKGGASLVMSYLGYFRFFKDLDFTWKNQRALRNLQTEKLETYLGERIREICDIFVEMSDLFGFDFKPDLEDERFLIIYENNKTMTCKLWYNSSINCEHTYIKIQINFMELILFPLVTRQMRSIIFENTSDLTEMHTIQTGPDPSIPSFTSYDCREILCEKIRALLTRWGSKTRDLMDAYFLVRKENLNIQELKPEILEKIVYSLSCYEKYPGNFIRNVFHLQSGSYYNRNDDMDLFLVPVDQDDYSAFIEEIDTLLKEIVFGISQLSCRLTWNPSKWD